MLTRRQLLEGGATPAQLRTRLGREWRLVLRGVVLLTNAVPSDEQRLVAASLFAGVLHLVALQIPQRVSSGRSSCAT